MSSDFVGNCLAEVHEDLRGSNYAKKFGKFIPCFFGSVFARDNLQDLGREAQGDVTFSLMVTICPSVLFLLDLQCKNCSSLDRS